MLCSNFSVVDHLCHFAYSASSRCEKEHLKTNKTKQISRDGERIKAQVGRFLSTNLMSRVLQNFWHARPPHVKYHA
jgi:hypothetical protein